MRGSLPLSIPFSTTRDLRVEPAASVYLGLLTVVPLSLLLASLVYGGLSPGAVLFIWSFSAVPAWIHASQAGRRIGGRRVVALCCHSGQWFVEMACGQQLVLSEPRRVLVSSYLIAAEFKAGDRRYPLFLLPDTLPRECWRRLARALLSLSP